jgi:transposase-like protein
MNGPAKKCPECNTRLKKERGKSFDMDRWACPSCDKRYSRGEVVILGV